MSKIRIGIVGYGNVGRGVEMSIARNEDMELAAVFTRRNPESVTIKTEGAKVVHMDDMLSMKEEIVASYAKIDELEETIHRLVSLLKDSNMGTARLLKKCQETNKVMSASTMRDFSDDMILIRDKVVAMRNLDEEVAKCAERNQIQLCDIQEEVQAQKNAVVELESDLSHLLDTAEEQLQ